MGKEEEVNFKLKKITIGKTINTGNYESIRVDVEFELREREAEFDFKERSIRDFNDYCAKVLETI